MKGQADLFLRFSIFCLDNRVHLRVSFYSYERICSTLEVTLDDYIAARNALIDKDLVAFDGSRFQVLSLPPRPVTLPRPPLVAQDDFDNEDPATIRRLIRDSLGEP